MEPNELDNYVSAENFYKCCSIVPDNSFQKYTWGPNKPGVRVGKLPKREVNLKICLANKLVQEIEKGTFVPNVKKIGHNFI